MTSTYQRRHDRVVADLTRALGSPPVAVIACAERNAPPTSHSMSEVTTEQLESSSGEQTTLTLKSPSSGFVGGSRSSGTVADPQAEPKNHPAFLASSKPPWQDRTNRSMQPPRTLARAPLSKNISRMQDGPVRQSSAIDHDDSRVDHDTRAGGVISSSDSCPTAKPAQNFELSGKLKQETSSTTCTSSRQESKSVPAPKRHLRTVSFDSDVAGGGSQQFSRSDRFNLATSPAKRSKDASEHDITARRDVIGEGDDSKRQRKQVVISPPIEIATDLPADRWENLPPHKPTPGAVDQELCIANKKMESCKEAAAAVEEQLGRMDLSTQEALHR